VTFKPPLQKLEMDVVDEKKKLVGDAISMVAVSDGGSKPATAIKIRSREHACV
jgi:hypothetical protein